MKQSLLRIIWARAGNKCEYCHLLQSLCPTPFEVDHIIAKQHGGRAAESNLALACLHCNGHKGPNIAGIDPISRRLVRLFNPRRNA